MNRSFEDSVKLLEGSFDFVLIVDNEERILYASPTVSSETGVERSELPGADLNMLTSGFDQDRWRVRVESFRRTMKEAREGKRGLVVFPSANSIDCSFTISSGFTETENGPLYLLHGNKSWSHSKYAEWEKDERIKQLTCLYAVADWIEVSASIKEFFIWLPKYLAAGMHSPEHAVVYSVYQGVEYGERPASRNSLKTTLEVNQQVRGHIIVGYDSNGYPLFPEEQKMLDEIGRMLEVELDRKELRSRLSSKQAQEVETIGRLRELEQEIEEREKTLSAQQEKLATINSYLGRINRDWEESKARFETMFMAIPDKVAMIDRKRDVVMTNWQSVTQGEKCYKTFFGIDAPCVDCRLLRIIKEKSPITMAVKHEDEYFEVHALPLYNKEHEVEGIFEFYKDITREKIYEQQLLQADKLASLGQLVSGIGHEINNPNQFIRGNIKIIQQAMEDILPILDEYHGTHPDLKIARLNYSFFRQHITVLVADMAHGADRIKGIVEGLRRFARKDEGLLTDKINVNACIEASSRLSQNQVNKSCDIQLELAPDLPAIVGNAQKIEQVLLNLIINASQAMPEQRRGLIVVRTRHENGNVLIEVKDNGKGMSERTVKNIFDPFFTTRRAQGGTGLGLSIAYRIIEEHGGAISAASKIDVGTTFTISIPVKRQAEARS
jgi:signal transduction histidine kinase